MEKLGLYLHVPFCLKKCPYCDFYSILKLPDEREYLLALKKEIQTLVKFLQEKFKLKRVKIITFYAGGGTPSLLSSTFYGELFSYLSKVLIFEPEELTIEVNPEGLTLKKIHEYRKAGFNRISIGIQSLSKKGLKFLGRLHDVKTAFKVLEDGSKVFDNLSVDLIYNWLGQGIKGLKKELKLLTSYPVKHVSLYELTPYPGTPFTKRWGEKQEKKNQRFGRALFLTAHEFLESKGFVHYEISNYARPGYECKHNLLYWEFKPYIGIGPSAVSRVKDLRFSNLKILEKLTPFDQAKEIVFMGLRLKKGFSLRRIERLLKKKIPLESLKLLQANGLIHIKGERITPTLEGFLRHNLVVKYLWQIMEDVSVRGD